MAAANNFYSLSTPDGATFRLIALNTSPHNRFMQLYPKELDLEVNKVFAESLLSDCQAQVLASRDMPRFIEEIRINGEYILGALAILVDAGCIDYDAYERLEAKLNAPNNNRPPLSERLAAFVTENENRMPQEYIDSLITMLKEYVGNLPVNEIIELAKGQFRQAWVKNAIETRLQPAPQEQEVVQNVQAGLPRELEDALVSLEALASSEAPTHEEVLDALTSAAIALASYNLPQEGLPQDAQLRIEAATLTISSLNIPPFDFNNEDHLALKQDIQQMWVNIMSKLNLDIPFSVEMNTDFDHELAQLQTLQEEGFE
jgi:hypothetical protein